MDKIAKALKDLQNISARELGMVRHHLSCITGKDVSITFSNGQPTIE